MGKLKNMLATAIVGASTFPVFAEGETTQNPLSEVYQKSLDYVGVGKDVVVGILTAGLVIVASFYIWRLIKKGLGTSK